MKYIKYWFECDGNQTAKLIAKDGLKHRSRSISAISYDFPYSECTKMQYYCESGPYDSFESAFNANDDAATKVRVNP